MTQLKAQQTTQKAQKIWPALYQSFITLSSTTEKSSKISNTDEMKKVNGKSNAERLQERPSIEVPIYRLRVAEITKNWPWYFYLKQKFLDRTLRNINLKTIQLPVIFFKIVTIMVKIVIFQKDNTCGNKSPSFLYQLEKLMAFVCWRKLFFPHLCLSCPPQFFPLLLFIYHLRIHIPCSDANTSIEHFDRSNQDSSNRKPFQHSTIYAFDYLPLCFREYLLDITRKCFIVCLVLVINMLHVILLKIEIVLCARGMPRPKCKCRDHCVPSRCSIKFTIVNNVEHVSLKEIVQILKGTPLASACF
ncbi:hypothetical protein EGR_02887 [Echinococcus granulosus]|uniref:Uncharacterized protein n=1 Tax=Echinococcus granulosus TaxID=6210 RepID=W6UKS3_ECHGR|nr:hypothetical protein EGR_02887 [Echinococcus granulosus]EUB62135.1 hypothetical protein EGR_02887 [Echinococcus granulosus]